MAQVLQIAKAPIGNALTSVADNHVVAVTEDIFDENFQKYQSSINEEQNQLNTSQEQLNKEYGGKLQYISAKLLDNFLYVIIDSNSLVLWGIKKDGSVYQTKGISEDAKKKFDELDLLNTNQNQRLELLEEFCKNEFYLN